MEIQESERLWQSFHAVRGNVVAVGRNFSEGAPDVRLSRSAAAVLVVDPANHRAVYM